MSCDSCDSILLDGLNGPLPAMHLCARLFNTCVTLSLQKCSCPENRTLPTIPHPLHEFSPSCLLPQINTHIHTQTHSAPTPWGAAGASSGGLWRGKKSFQEDSHLLLSCCRPRAGKKNPPLFLPLSPFLAMPAKKLGRAAL